MFSTQVASKTSLDLAYVPPFGSANDPINTAGFVADHIVRGDVATMSPEDWQPNDEFIPDVREASEVAESASQECRAL